MISPWTISFVTLNFPFSLRSPARLVGALLIALLGVSVTVRAQSAGETEPGGIEGLLRATGIRHGPISPQDFVVKSRASAPRHDFMPVGVTPPEHSIRVKTPEEIKATTASLDALRGGHAHLAGRKPALHSRKHARRPTPAPVVIRGAVPN